jgi:cardiolipin synthase
MTDTTPNDIGSRRYLTAPNAFTLLRLCCLPVFLYLLHGRDDLAAAGWVLLAIGLTDWVDGWLARRFNQVSEFGKVFDPIADRLLFFVSLIGIIAYPVAPLWFFWLVLIREAVFGVTVAVATVVFKMQRFDVTYWGKLATFLLMGAIPAFVVGASTFPVHQFFTWLAYAVGIPGLALSYWTALAYAPTIRDSLRTGRAARAGHR